LEATGPKAETNPWRWATKSLDKETGLVYFGLRYYDPATGQWLSREPLGEGESLNLYAYCHNDPINRVDVLGAAEWRVTGTKIENGRPMVEYTETEQSLWQFLWAGGSNVRKREWREATVYQRNQGWIFHYNDGWKLGPEPALQQQMAAIGEHMKGGPEFCEKLLVGSWGSVAAAPLTPWVASGAPVVAGQSYGGSIATSLWGQTAVKVGVAAGGAVLGAEAISNPGQTWEFIQQATAEGLSVGPAFPIMVAGRAPGAISNFGRGSLRWPQWAKPEVWRVVPGCNSFGFQLERVAAKSGGPLTRLKNWWNTGSEADGAWRALSLKDKAFYEIGQKTLPGKTFENYAALDPLARGRALVDDLGWGRAIWPQGTGYRLGAGTTLHTGPTPLVRWAAPRAAGAGAAAGAGYYFFGSED
jgi:RHS repeat-associated protein